MSTKDIQWTGIARHISGPKREWFVEQLKQAGIAHRTSNISLRGNLVEVDYDRFIEAHEILYGVIGEFLIGLAPITWDDLPDNHPLFTSMLEIGRETHDVPELIVAKPTALPEMAFRTVKLEMFGHEEEFAMYDCQSTNVSAIGFVDFTPGQICIVAQFKGGDTYYRYHGKDEGKEMGKLVIDDFKALYHQIERKSNGDKDASVGREFNRRVRTPAENGVLSCEKLGDKGLWLIVPPKSKRKKGQKLQVCDLTIERLEPAGPVPPIVPVEPTEAEKLVGESSAAENNFVEIPEPPTPDILETKHVPQVAPEYNFDFALPEEAQEAERVPNEFEIP